MSNKNKYDQFNLPPVGPNLCDFYGQYIGFGGGNGGASGVSVTSIANSALYDTANTEYLSKTPDAAGDSTTTWTMSFWVCRSRFGGSNGSSLFGCTPASNTTIQVYFSTSDTLKLHYILSTTDKVVLETTQKFRDNGWYHICVVADTSNALANDRVRFIVNGQRITDFSTETQSSGSGNNIAWNSASTNHVIGAILNTQSVLSWPADSYFAEVVFLDGTASTNGSEFAEYDSSGLYWTPKSSTEIKALTFGTNGFYLDNATNAQTDASGNGNNYTNNNTVTLSTHTPTNYTALLNPLYATNGSLTYSNGNRSIGPDGTVNEMTCATLAIPPNSGKWYFDVSWDTWANAYDDGYIGIALGSLIRAGMSNPTTDSNQWSIYMTDPIQITLDGSNINTTQAFSQIGDIFQVAYDSDTGKLFLGYYDASATAEKWFSGDGTATAGDPSAGSNPTVTLSVADRALPLFPFAGIAGNSGQKFTVNFEENEFARTAPTGFKALTTTNIASATTRTASDTNKYFQTVLYEGNGQGQRLGKFLPFTDTYTVGNSALFSTANADLTRSSMDGTGGTWTFSAWVKRTEPATGGTTANFIFTTASNAGLSFGNNSTADLISWYSGSYTSSSTAVVDQSQWFNYVFKNDGGTGTVFLNGVEVLGSLTVHAADGTMAVGSYNADSNELDGYMAEVVFIDGLALAPTSFAKTETSTNRWVPIDVSGLTYNGNSFYLNFANTSDLGNDVSGNNKDFTNNVGVLSSTDSPTTNIAVLNGMTGTVAPLTNGNLTVTSQSSSDNMNALSTIPLTGKVYFEFQTATLGTNCSAGLTTTTHNFDDYAGGNVSSFGWHFADGKLYNRGASVSDTPATLSNGVRGCIALDMNIGAIWTGQVSSGTVTWDNSGDPETGANPIITTINTELTWFALISGRGSSVVTAFFNSGDWTGSTNRPASFKALTQDNITTNSQRRDGTDQFITAFSWIKNRDATDSHLLADRVRGINKYVHSNNDVVEETEADVHQQFFKGGLQIGSDDRINTANESFVFWNWMIEATGSGTSNTDGSINTVATLVDQTFGLSISTYTGTGSNATVGHGLGAVPKVIFIKNRGVDDSWAVYYGDNTDYLILSSSASTVDDATMWQDTTPTSTVWSIGTNHKVNADGENYIAYCFGDSQFLSVGSYTNNNNANGPFVSTVNSLGLPIQPTWIMTKTFASASWIIIDNKRLGYNVDNNNLLADTTVVEATTDKMDIVTGGFKLRTASDPNYQTATSIYMAFGSPIIDTSGRIIAGR